MQDEKIVALLWERKEIGIRYMMEQYQRYAHSIALRILNSREDAAECVNQAWLAVWRSIPPHRPAILAAFIGKIVRRISFQRRRADLTQKRGGGQAALALEELAECLPDIHSVEAEMDRQALVALLNDFLSRLPAAERNVFVLRYWYLYSLADICRKYGYSQSKVKSMLYRTRQKLQNELEKEGVWS